MPEDEGVNGDIWTREASQILTHIGWKKVADCNIDIMSSDGHKHGIDALFRYEEGFRPNFLQGVFLEAKRYGIKSFNPKKIQDWVICLDHKIGDLRMSENFNTQYPEMEKTNPINGLLTVWFHNTENYQHFFLNSFNKALLSVKTPRKRNSSIHRLFVLENYGILKLCSLIDSVNKWNKENDKTDTQLKFYYPSSAGFGYATQEIPVLNLEYIYSKFILAKAKEFIQNSIRTVDIVFYFGMLNIDSFARLKEALLIFDMLNSSNNLYIYLYNRDDDFRKIEPDVINMFKEKGVNLKIRKMEKFADLPAWLT